MKTHLEDKYLSDSDNSLKQVARVDGTNVNPETFAKEYRKDGIPVVITSLLNSLNNWDLEFLRDKLGNQEFPVRFNGWDRYKKEKNAWNNIGSGVESRTLSFNEYADLLSSKEAHKNDIYLGRCALKQTPLADTPELEEADTKLGLKMPGTSPNLWVCPGSHITPLHYDPLDGTLIQIHGEKRIVLFAPSQTYNLYPLSLFNYLKHGLKLRANYSQVYPENPDFAKFPKFKKALSYRYEVILKQGEILFIPA